MVVGILRVKVKLFGGQSLKEKRQVVKSIVTRLRNRFNISISEIDNHNLWQRATLGISTIAPDSGRAHQILSRVLESLKREKYLSLLEKEIEII